MCTVKINKLKHKISNRDSGNFKFKVSSNNQFMVCKMCAEPVAKIAIERAKEETAKKVKATATVTELP